MNITNGCYESSLQFSQQAYLGLSELHYELEQAVIKWQTSFETTLADGYELLAVIERNHEVNAIGLEGEDLPYRLDVNYWTQGKYERLLDYSRQLADYITGGQTALSTDELSQIATQVFPAIRESLENIVFEARISALNSQIRMNIAETAFRALEKQGFELEDAGYRGGDMRSSFNARVECVDGTEVIVQVLPTDKSVEEISNDLVVMTSHPTMKTEHEARMRWDELRRTLNQYNLIVGKVEADQPASETNSLENSPFQNHNIEQAEG